MLTKDDILPFLPPTGNFLVSFAFHNTPMGETTIFFSKIVIIMGNLSSLFLIFLYSIVMVSGEICW